MKVQVTVKVQANGRITIPKVIREALALEPGDWVQFPIHEDGTVTMQKGS